MGIHSTEKAKLNRTLFDSIFTFHIFMPPQYLIAIVLTRSNFTAVKRANEFAIQPVKWPRVFKVHRRFWWSTRTSKWETTQSQMKHACSKCAHALRRVQPLHFPFQCPYDLMIPFRIKYHSGRSETVVSASTSSFWALQHKQVHGYI